MNEIVDLAPVRKAREEEAKRRAFHLRMRELGPMLVAVAVMLIALVFA